MNRSEFEHIIRASAEVTKEKEFIVIGSQAILGKVPDAPRSLRVSYELDLYPKNRPELGEEIEGSLGELSQFHAQFGVCAHGIGPETATLPPGWEKRLVEVRTEGTNGATAWCLDPHDIAFSKLAAGREKDLEYVAELKKHKIIRPWKIMAAIGQLPLGQQRELISGRWRKIENANQKLSL